MPKVIIPKPAKAELGPKQAQSVVGPNGPAMVSFVCSVCDNKYFDMGSYFYDKPSVKCMWCTKYGKKKKVSTASVLP